MRCDESRLLLPEYSGEPFPHELEVHLATCTACAAEERAYRETLAQVAAIGVETEQLPPRFLDDVLSGLTRPDRVRGVVRRFAHDRSSRYVRARYAAAASIGGVVVGAAALAIMRRRLSRRAA
jgi:anti-sigma factor RsiW